MPKLGRIAAEAARLVLRQRMPSKVWHWTLFRSRIFKRLHMSLINVIFKKQNSSLTEVASPFGHSNPANSYQNAKTSVHGT
jgi:hypothetical protein